MSTSSEHIQKDIEISMIKQRMIDKIKDLFEKNQSGEGRIKYLNSILNQENIISQGRENAKKIMVDSIEKLDLSNISSYEQGINACIEVLKNQGINTTNWILGRNNIQDILLDAKPKFQKDVERKLKEISQEQIRERQVLYLKQLGDEDIEFEDVPKEIREMDDFLLECLKDGIISPYRCIDEKLLSRSREIQDIVDKKAILSMFQLLRKSDEIPLNRMIYMHVLKKDNNALKSLPKKFSRDEEFLLTAVKLNAAQLEFVPDDMKQQIVDAIGPENLLKNNILSYKFFPENETNSNAINSFMSKIEYLVINPTLRDAELRDTTLVYGNKEKRIGKTAFVGFNFSKQSYSEISSESMLKQLDELIISLKKANNQNDLHLVLSGHGSTDLSGKSIGSISHSDTAKLCKKHEQIKHINLLTCSAASGQDIPEEERTMIGNFAKKAKETKNYGFQKIPYEPGKPFEEECRKFCAKRNLDGVYFVSENPNKKASPKYRLHIMKFDHDNLISNKTIPIPLGKERDMERFLAKRKLDGSTNPILSILELSELRATTKVQHRFSPDHPKFAQDKTQYPFLAKFEINEQDLKKSSMKNLVDALRANDITQEIDVQGYTGYMEVNTETNYLHGVKSHVFHLSDGESEAYYKSLYGTNETQVERKKLKEEQHGRLKEMLNGQSETSMAKKLKVVLRSLVNTEEEKAEEIIKNEAPSTGKESSISHSPEQATLVTQTEEIVPPTIASPTPPKCDDPVTNNPWQERRTEIKNSVDETERPSEQNKAVTESLVNPEEKKTTEKIKGEEPSIGNKSSISHSPEQVTSLTQTKEIVPETTVVVTTPRFARCEAPQTNNPWQGRRTEMNASIDKVAREAEQKKSGSDQCDALINKISGRLNELDARSSLTDTETTKYKALMMLKTDLEKGNYRGYTNFLKNHGAQSNSGPDEKLSAKEQNQIKAGWFSHKTEELFDEADKTVNSNTTPRCR